MADINLDLDSFPFSRRESNWSIFTEDAGRHSGDLSPRLDSLPLYYIFAGRTRVYDLILVAPERADVPSDWRHDTDLDTRRIRVPFRYRATPSKLSLFVDRPEGEATDSALRAEIIFPGPHQLRVRTCGCGLLLRPAEEIRDRWESLLPVSVAERGIAGRRNHESAARSGVGEKKSLRAVVGTVKHDFHLLAGELDCDTDWGPRPEGARRHQFSRAFALTLSPGCDLLIHDYRSEPDRLGPIRSFEAEEQDVAAEVEAWCAAGPEVPDRYRETADRAACLTWASLVPAFGNFREPVMIMSKRRMNNAWNWDNYFNAWAMSLRDPDLAWRMYQLHFDHQDERGALPDGINEEKVGWTYTKPPVHGLVLAKLIRTGRVGNERLADIYPKLQRATEWWFRYRDDDGDLVCQYHHGNDSGWDDATLFDLEPPTESPDLSALLVLQLRVLADVADLLGYTTNAVEHRNRAEQVLARLLEHSVDHGRFVARQDTTHRVASGESLLTRVPVVLGSLLPQSLVDTLESDLTDEQRFLGAHGLATESMESKQFLPEGYWRGPSWAPALMLIVEGLIDAGRTGTARRIAERFCDTCAESGFAECFNPHTGAPLHDRGYTWTASVFLILADWLHRLG